MKFSVIAFICSLTLSLTAVGASAEEPEPEIDIQTIDCRTMLKMDNDEQELTLIYFHGFKSGQDGDMMFDGPVLREATNEIMDWCIDNPAESLMKAFEEKR